jgi:ADP-heptose:LPS heptosyltransferase
VLEAIGLSLVETAALLERCTLFVGNDSGLSHLAAALGIPTVAVFGPTDPSVWAPRGRRVEAVRTSDGTAWPTVNAVMEAVAHLSRAS